MSEPEAYADAPQEIRNAVERLIRDYGNDPALLAGAIVSATSSVIAAARKEERDQIFSKVLANPPSVVLDAMAAERSDQITRNGHGEWGFREIWLAGVRAVRGET